MTTRETEQLRQDGYAVISGNRRYCVADTIGDTAFIVRACNSHAALVEALEPFAELVGRFGSDSAMAGKGYSLAPEVWDAARAALAAARGEEGAS